MKIRLNPPARGLEISIQIRQGLAKANPPARGLEISIQIRQGLAKANLA